MDTNLCSLEIISGFFNRIHIGGWFLAREPLSQVWLKASRQKTPNGARDRENSASAPDQNHAEMSQSVQIQHSQAEKYEKAFVKRIHTIPTMLALTLALCISSPAAESVWSIDTGRLGVLQRASTLIGMKVLDPDGKKLGTISDFLLDLKTGQAVAILIAAGDAEQLVPIPAVTYQYVSSGRVVVAAHRGLLAAAPRVPKTDPSCALQASRREAMFRYFGLPEPVAAVTDSGEFALAASVLGARLADRSNAHLGVVKELMLDLGKGRMVYVVVEPAKEAAAASELYVVPPVLIEPDGAEHRLVLAVERAKFLAGPGFQKVFWADVASPSLAEAVAGHFGLAITKPGPETVAEKEARSDSAINQAIMTELVRQVRGLATIRVVVTTLHGRVTVTGRVKNEDQRRFVLEAAERIAGAGNVEDHLETGRKPRVAQL